MCKAAEGTVNAICLRDVTSEQSVMSLELKQMRVCITKPNLTKTQSTKQNPAQRLQL